MDFTSLFGSTTQSGLRLSWLVFWSWRSQRGADTFCRLLHFMRGWLFSSVTVCLLLCESTSGLFLRPLWPFRANFFFPLEELEVEGGTLAWLCSRFWEIHVSCESSSLFSCRVLKNGFSKPGDVWMALSITPSGLGLAGCSETNILSSLRVFSNRFCFPSCSSLRRSRLLFMLCWFESSSAVESSLWMRKIVLITN